MKKLIVIVAALSFAAFSYADGCCSKKKDNSKDTPACCKGSNGKEGKCESGCKEKGDTFDNGCKEKSDKKCDDKKPEETKK